MEKVYIVLIGAFSERRVAGVFSTKEKAEETAAVLEENPEGEPVFIHDYPFDQPLGQLYEFEIKLVDGEWKEIRRHAIRQEYSDFSIKYDWGNYAIYARSFEEAVEIAKKME